MPAGLEPLSPHTTVGVFVSGAASKVRHEGTDGVAQLIVRLSGLSSEPAGSWCGRMGRKRAGKSRGGTLALERRNSAEKNETTYRHNFGRARNPKNLTESQRRIGEVLRHIASGRTTRLVGKAVRGSHRTGVKPQASKGPQRHKQQRSSKGYGKHTNSPKNFRAEARRPLGITKIRRRTGVKPQTTRTRTPLAQRCSVHPPARNTAGPAVFPAPVLLHFRKDC